MIFQYHCHKFILIFQSTLPMAVPQKQMWRHRPQHSHTQLNNNHAGLHTYRSNEPSAWHVRSWAHQLTYILTCTISGSMAVCWQEQLHYHHATWSQLSVQNNTLYGLPKLIMGERHLEVVSWVIVTSLTGDCNLGWDQPWPNLSSSSKPWFNPFGWQTKFTTHWVIHGDDHPTHTLHPTLGIAYALLHQEGQVPITASPTITNCTYVPTPAILFLPFSFLLLSLTLIQTCNTPECQSLDAVPWHTVTTNDTYSNSTSWDQHNHKWF